MEENKTKKVSLSTILLIIAVIIIIIMACYIYAEKNKPNTTQEPQPQTNVLSNSQENKQTNNKVENDDKQKIINILKDADNDKYAYFDVNKINYTNNDYSVETTYNKPITITKDKLEELKNDKKITLNNEVYEYVTDQNNPNGYIQNNGKKYEIINYNNGYAFNLSGLAGGYTQTINTTENMKFVADENTTIYDSFESKLYKLNDDTAKNWLNRSLEGTIVRLRYSNDLGLSIFIDNK